MAVRTPDDKTSELQKNDSLDVKEKIEGEKKRDSSENKDELSWVKIVLAVAIVIAVIAVMVSIKIYRRKTSSS